MPDISMCRDVKCPSRTKCYRFTAVPSPLLQSFAEFNRAKDAEKCKSYWPNFDTLHEEIVGHKPRRI